MKNLFLATIICLLIPNFLLAGPHGGNCSRSSSPRFYRAQNNISRVNSIANNTTSNGNFNYNVKSFNVTNSAVSNSYNVTTNNTYYATNNYYTNFYVAKNNDLTSNTRSSLSYNSYSAATNTKLIYITDSDYHHISNNSYSSTDSLSSLNVSRNRLSNCDLGNHSAIETTIYSVHGQDNKNYSAVLQQASIFDHTQNHNTVADITQKRNISETDMVCNRNFISDSSNLTLGNKRETNYTNSTREHRTALNDNSLDHRGNDNNSSIVSGNKSVDDNSLNHNHNNAVHGNNGVGNGIDSPPPGNPPVNDGPGTGPGNPGNKGGANSLGKDSHNLNDTVHIKKNN